MLRNKFRENNFEMDEQASFLRRLVENRQPFVRDFLDKFATETEKQS